ncbi:MAG: agmatinase [Candidatus Latescibacterota bacterium]
MPLTGVFFRPQSSIETADAALIGLPWDGTVSNRPGARFGPEAIRSATLGIEDYSPYLDRDIAHLKIHDAGDIELPFGDTSAALDMIRREYAALVKSRPVALGGEHLVSWPMVQEMYERYGKDLFVIQFDAHTDLREQYLGVELSHATVMKLITDLVGVENTAAVGIRSGTSEEWNILRRHPHYFGGIAGKPLETFPAFAADTLRGKKIYLTVDLDIFDPGIMPGTGTPEPGGITFREFIPILRSLIKTDIVGADIVELAPAYDHSGISQALAGTILRELLLIIGSKS